ncbi:MAG TPA: UMP kinase [Candidatus Paceibacterota bacterium]|jgi:uridylate kinase|nr:UMP kinase [Candidatus Paceibacterota bacterium]
MKYKFGKTVVVALGGSIVHPDGIDAAFLKKFKKFIGPFLRRGTKFVLVVGGGRLARRFQEAAHAVSRVTDEDKDWLGIHATRLNAHLLRTVFRDVADPVVIDARYRLRKLTHPVTIAAGWRPGWSTDYVALQLAADYKVPEAIIAGSPTHVYDKDYSKYPDATRFHELTWPAYRRLIPRAWKPGLHAPVDPVGAALGARTGTKAIIVGGRDLKNFSALLNGKEFRGTIIG